MNKKGYYIMIKMSILPNLLLTTKTWLLLLLSRFSRDRLCATPQMAARQVPPSLGFPRQEHWSGLPLPSPVHESEVAQSCLTLSDPMDCSLPGFSIHGIFQARVLQQGAMAFSKRLPKYFLLGNEMGRGRNKGGIGELLILILTVLLILIIYF